MGTSPWGTPAQGPPGGGKRANTERGHHRQPVGQDDGKGGPRGYDAGKKVMGRKRHIIVDTIGLLLAVVVHPADIQDRDGAKLVINKLMGRFPRLRLIWADAGYAGRLVDWAQALGGYVLAIVRRPRDSHRFEVLPRRWVVERTFAWLGRCRRLSKDFEALPHAPKVEPNLIDLLTHPLRPDPAMCRPESTPDTSCKHTTTTPTMVGGGFGPTELAPYALLSTFFAHRQAAQLDRRWKTVTGNMRVR